MKFTLMHAVVATLLSAGIFGSGCSSSDAGTVPGSAGTSPTDPTGSSTLDGGVGTSTSTLSLEAQIGTAVCAQEQQCLPLTFTTRYRDVADCVARNAKAYAKRLHAPSTAGLATQVPACAAAIKARACDGDPFVEACFFKGTVATGGACSFASQCQTGSCSSSTRTACGTCVEIPTLGVGGDCSANPCSSALYCDGKSKKCTAYAKENESCATATCASSLNCSTGSTRTCRKPVAKGGDCSESYCGVDLDCVDNVCVDLTIVKTGETCGYDPNTGKTPYCLAGDCRDLDDNFENGKCGPAGEEGAACSIIKNGCSPELACIDKVCRYVADLRVCN